MHRCGPAGSVPLPCSAQERCAGRMGGWGRLQAGDVANAEQVARGTSRHRRRQAAAIRIGGGDGGGPWRSRSVSRAARAAASSLVKKHRAAELRLRAAGAAAGASGAAAASPASPRSCNSRHTASVDAAGSISLRVAANDPRWASGQMKHCRRHGPGRRQSHMPCRYPPTPSFASAVTANTLVRHSDREDTPSATRTTRHGVPARPPAAAPPHPSR